MLFPLDGSAHVDSTTLFFLHEISVEFLMIEIYETVIKPLIDGYEYLPVKNF